jgi:hypothetical protein
MAAYEFHFLLTHPDFINQKPQVFFGKRPAQHIYPVKGTFGERS